MPLLPADFTQPSLQIILRINLDGTRTKGLKSLLSLRSLWVYFAADLSKNFIAKFVHLHKFVNCLMA